MALDSKAAFKERLPIPGLGGYTAKLDAHGWDAMPGFTFATGYIPGASGEEAFVTDIVAPILERIDSNKRTAMRRLFF